MKELELEEWTVGIHPNNAISERVVCVFHIGCIKGHYKGAAYTYKAGAKTCLMCDKEIPQPMIDALILIK